MQVLHPHLPHFPKSLQMEERRKKKRSAHAFVLGEIIDQLCCYMKCSDPTETIESGHLGSSGPKLLQHWDPVCDHTKKMYIVKKTGL